MKNLITITSILAAGTLCANAAVNLGDNWTTGTLPSSYQAINEIPSMFGTVGTSDLKGMGFAPDGELLLTLGTIYSRHASEATLATNDSFLSWDSTNETLLLGNKNGKNGTLAFIANQLSSDAITALKNSSGTLSLTFSASGVSSDQNLGVSVLYAPSDFSSWTIVARDTLSTSGSASIELLDTVTYSDTGYFIVILGTGSTATGSKGTWADSNTEKYTVKISGLTMSIPEPSMFGLLAGTLALGLAGTRRRRAK